MLFKKRFLDNHLPRLSLDAVVLCTLRIGGWKKIPTSSNELSEWQEIFLSLAKCTIWGAVASTKQGRCQRHCRWRRGMKGKWRLPLRQADACQLSWQGEPTFKTSAVFPWDLQPPRNDKEIFFLKIKNGKSLQILLLKK
jgi:hypothetical protein